MRLHQRNISGPRGDLAAVRGYDGTIALQLTNLHGDVIATTTAGLGNTTSTFDSTELGAPRTTADVGTRRYGWLGAKTREADSPSGIIRMGVRLYDPQIGRFLQKDPVPGGNANSYVYPADPIQGLDLDGRYCFVGCGWRGPRLPKWTAPFSAPRWPRSPKAPQLVRRLMLGTVSWQPSPRPRQRISRRTVIGACDNVP